MSLWLCDGHGFTGPMPCCSRASRATVMADDAVLVETSIATATTAQDETLVWYEAQQMNPAVVDGGGIA